MGDWDSKWMEGVRKDWKEEPAEKKQQELSLNQTSPKEPVCQTWRLQTLRTLRPWFSFAPVGVVCFLYHLEMLQHPALLVCVLWVVLGGCICALQRCLQPGQTQEEVRQMKIQDVAFESQKQCSWLSPTQRSELLPLVHTLCDSLLLCILQEPLSDPSVPHIESLVCRLEAVAQTLQKVDFGSAAVFEQAERGSKHSDKPELICTYLQQRVETLGTLVQVQRDFEAAVNDMLQGLDGLWVQLEELHAGVTLTKQEGQGHKDLASAQTDAKTLFAVLGHYRNRLQSSQIYLKDSTQLLQELIWSHTHISSRADISGESVWPELLLQSNIEQFDKVQENFGSLEQQTATFQAHLEGLGKENGEGVVGVLTLSNRVQSGIASSQTSHNDSGKTVDELTTEDPPLSLCERSALQFSSTIGRLRLSGRRRRK